MAYLAYVDLCYCGTCYTVCSCRMRRPDTWSLAMFARPEREAHKGSVQYSTVFHVPGLSAGQQQRPKECPKILEEKTFFPLS